MVHRTDGYKANNGTFHPTFEAALTAEATEFFKRSLDIDGIEASDIVNLVRRRKELIDILSQEPQTK